MDSFSILGIIIAFGAVLGSQYFDGGSLHTLINLPALAIVLLGSLGAVLLETPKEHIKSAFVLFPQAFKSLPSLDSTVRECVRWSSIARKDGKLALENYLFSNYSGFTKRAIQLIIDGNDVDQVKQILTYEMQAWENKLLRSAKVFESWGGYSPTLGILAAVLGLVHVMENLSEPQKLGSGIAVAFVGTIYGVGFANMVFIPISKKLKHYVHHMLIQKIMITESAISILKGESPDILRSKLESMI
jgi:chemotaxis protein MotA